MTAFATPPAINRPTVKLRPYQQAAHDRAFEEFGKGVPSTLIVHATGCHHPDQEILMIDGTTKRAANIRVGDVLIGPDSTPRNVLRLHRGWDEMYRIIPVKGEPFIVNGGHVLTLAKTNTRKPVGARDPGKVLAVDVTVRDWLGWHKTNKHIHKLFRVPVRFQKGEALPIPAYFAGILLGDGSLDSGSIAVTTADPEIEDYCHRIADSHQMPLRVSSREGNAASSLYFSLSLGGWRGRNPIKNLVRKAGLVGMRCEDKHIPHAFKVASYGARLNLLAGLIDTDGSHSEGHYDFISKSRRLSEDVVFVARSLGLAAYLKECQKCDQNKTWGTYYRVGISGNTQIVPCRIPRKVAPIRRQIKDHRRTGFSVEAVGFGEYFGFTVDGDHRYLMGDFTVTHNCGKSLTLGAIARTVIDDHGGRVLVLAHREILIKQLADSMAVMEIEAAVEKAEQNARAALWTDPMCVVGSVQTMQRKRLMSWPKNYFKCIIVDESHHSVSRTYRNILEHLEPEWLLGVTATADRLDGANLGRIYKSVAHEYTLRDGIADGWLAPIRIVRCETSVDLTKIRTTAGDLNQGDLEEAIRPHIDELANATRQEIGSRRTILFTPDVGSAEAAASALCSLGIKAQSVSCYSKDREAIFDGFRANRFQVLCNAQLLTEGADFPFVSAIALWRPTKSRAAYSQMVGRGTRKKVNGCDCLIVDFAWLTRNHKLVTPVELFDNSSMDPEVQKIARKSLDDGETDDLMEAIERAEETVKERARLRVKAQQRQVLYRRVSYDPFSVMTEVLGISVKPESDAALKNKLSDKQLAVLTRFGITDAANMSKKRASMMLDALIGRSKAGLASPKMVGFALSLGMEPDVARSMSFADMKKFLDANAKSR